MILINNFFVIYLIFIVSIILHETMHIMMCLILKTKITKIKIGFELFSIKIKNISISPICFYGFVEYNEKSKMKIIFIALSGPLINLFIFFFSFVSNDWIALMIRWINIIIFLVNIIPNPISKNDGYLIIKNDSVNA